VLLLPTCLHADQPATTVAISNQQSCQTAAPAHLPLCVHNEQQPVSTGCSGPCTVQPLHWVALAWLVHKPRGVIQQHLGQRTGLATNQRQANAGLTAALRTEITVNQAGQQVMP
jgi:hypothetical protein